MRPEIFLRKDLKIVRAVCFNWATVLAIGEYVLIDWATTNWRLLCLSALHSYWHNRSCIFWTMIFWVWTCDCQFEEWWHFVRLTTWRFCPHYYTYSTIVIVWCVSRSAKQRLELLDTYSVDIKSAHWEMTNWISIKLIWMEVNLISITYLIVDHFLLD